MDGKNVAQVFLGDDGGWQFRFLAGPEREQIVGLFGTDVLPLPYMQSATKEEVMPLLRRNHPESEWDLL